MHDDQVVAAMVTR